MKLITYTVPVLILLLSFFYNTNPFIVKEEARRAYEYLNTVRLTPEQFYDSLHLDTGLSINKTALHWNDTLARVAEAKAVDMARRNYSGHIDPGGFGIDYYLELSGYANASCFESLLVGAADGQEAVRALILDKDRGHLLGIGKRSWPLVDVGVGFVKCDVGKERTYTCIIIAKH